MVGQADTNAAIWKSAEVRQKPSAAQAEQAANAKRAEQLTLVGAACCLFGRDDRLHVSLDLGAGNRRGHGAPVLAEYPGRHGDPGRLPPRR